MPTTLNPYLLKGEVYCWYWKKTNTGNSAIYCRWWIKG